MRFQDAPVSTREPVRLTSERSTIPGIPGVNQPPTVTVGLEALSREMDQILRVAFDRGLSLDTEGEGLGAAAKYLKAVQFGTVDQAWVFDPRDPVQYEMIRDIVEEARALYIHNTPFDVPALAANGLAPKDLTKIWDTLIWARLAEPDERTSKSLTSCVERWLGLKVETNITERARRMGLRTTAQYFRTADLDRPAYLWDAATDAVATARLVEKVRRAAYDRITTGHPFTSVGVTGDEAWRLVDREQRINQLFLDRTVKGMRWDPEYLDQYQDGIMADQTAAEAELDRYGITPGHSGSLTAYLEREGLLPDGYPRTGKTGQPSGAKDHLAALTDISLVETFLGHKSRGKALKDYLAKVRDMADEHGRVHPVVNILGAVSGRMSYQDPPIHQFDAPARGILLEEPGAGLVSIDWSQIEPFTAACLAKDSDVVRDYEDKSRKADLYLTVGTVAHQPRKVAKVIVLAKMYGEGVIKLALDLGLITPAQALLIQIECDRREEEGLPRRFPAEVAEDLGIKGVGQALAIQDTVARAMPKTFAMLAKLKAIAKEFKVTFTLSGRILPIPAGYYRGRYSVSAHKGPNYTVQGSAYDILAETLISIIEADLQSAVELAMHDELVVQREAAHDIRRIMETPPPRLIEMAGRVPVLRTDMADLGERWSVA